MKKIVVSLCVMILTVSIMIPALADSTADAKIRAAVISASNFIASNPAVIGYYAYDCAFQGCTALAYTELGKFHEDNVRTADGGYVAVKQRENTQTCTNGHIYRYSTTR